MHEPPSEHAADTGRAAVRPWVPRLARLMDGEFRLPGTSFRFGLDPIIGLVPVVGDTATFVIGLAMLAEARRLSMPRTVMANMIGNLALDWLVGLVPGIDLILDSVVKAHRRNATLLVQEAAKPRNHNDTPRPATGVTNGRVAR